MLYSPRHRTALRRQPGGRATRTSLFRVVCAVLAVGIACAAFAVAATAHAAKRPTVTGLSRQHGPYWGATFVTVHGTGFDNVRRVIFEERAGYSVHVISSTELTVLTPYHNYGTVDVRVVTSAGTSRRTQRDRFRFIPPTMNTPIMGGMSAHQEQVRSARLRATHHGVFIAARRNHWTPAMAETAVSRARSWLGLPYSWAGGNGRGPTYGVCAHNGGDLDCHVDGFDCSGLTLYAWSPYESLVHFAATQRGEAGRFHPRIRELLPGDLVFFSGYIAGGIGHTAIYIGDGMVIQAAQSGTPVMESRLSDVIAESGVYRGATRPMSTGRQGPPPRVTSISRPLPTTGGTLEITGQHLGSVSEVKIGATVIYHFMKQGPRRLVVAAPPHAAGTVPIVVSNGWGMVQRTITYQPAPHLAGVSPASGPTSGDTVVTVTGTHFDKVTGVRLGGQSVSFHVADARHLTFTTPPHPAGTVTVVLDSHLGSSNAGHYTFVAPVPSSTPPSSPPSSSTSPPAPSGRASAPHAPTRFHHPHARRHERGLGGDRIGDLWYLIGHRYLAGHHHRR